MLHFIEVRELSSRSLPYRYAVHISSMYHYQPECWGYARPMMYVSNYFTNLPKALDKAIELHNDTGYPIVRTHWRICPTIADMGHRPVAVSEAQRRAGISSGFTSRFDDGIGV